MTSFTSLGLSPELLQTLHTLGFETPTPVQEKVIPLLLNSGQDIVAIAQTGTGKTAAFGLPLIEILHDNNHVTQALILAPTRELCLQITNDLQNFAQHVKKLNIVAVYGGASISEQIKKIKKGAPVIVATPGRLMDLMERKVVNISALRFVILDEADEMLNMGFKEDIDFILSHTKGEKNTWLFSATMPDEVRRISKRYMHNPHEITIGEKNKGNVNIIHQYMVVDEKDRYAALKRVVDYNTDIFGLIFCRTKADTQRVADNLMKDGYNADALHGDLTQGQRDKVMKNFKDKTLQLLVATDVAARGIDVNNISHVIHLNLPNEMEYYTHRSGRTARAGRTGISIALVTKKELYQIRQIENSIKISFEKKLIPTGKQVCEKRLLTMVHRLRDVQIADDEIARFLPAIYEELMELSKEDIIKRFTSLEFNHFLDYYRDAPDLNRGERADAPGEKFAERFSVGDRLFINLGKMDGLDKGKLLAFICDRTHIKSSNIGRIELKGAYSFFDVDKSISNKVKDSLSGFEYKGRLIRVEMTGADPYAKNKSKKTFDDKKGYQKKKKKWRG